MVNFTFSTTKTILCELGASLKVADLCHSLAIDRVMIVTDPGVSALGLLDPSLAALKASNIDFIVFDKVLPDPPESTVIEATDLARSHKISGVIGFGGGSSLDVAKLVAVLATGQQRLSDIYGIGKVKGARLALIQIPTTAGTGSEVTPIAIITTGETTKQGVVSPQLLPDVALLDANLTLGLPAHITAATGIDAMVHAIEAYTSRHRKNPYSDMLAKEALRLLVGSIRTAVTNGSDAIARSNMLYGAMLAGQSFANAPVAAVHALAYPLGGHYHISHGLSNSLVLPHVLRFNAEVASTLYSEIATIIDPTIQSKNEFDRTHAMINSLANLTQELGLQTTLHEMSIPESSLAMLADDAMLQQRLLINNPRELTRDDALNIYRAAYR